MTLQLVLRVFCNGANPEHDESLQEMEFPELPWHGIELVLGVEMLEWIYYTKSKNS